MGFGAIIPGRSRCQYKRLISAADIEVARPKRRWLKKLKGLRLPKSRKMTVKVFSLFVLQRRIAKISAHIVSRIKMDEICPAIVFSTQWGLPVLSHSSVRCRMNVISNRKPEMLTARAF